jgi:hypothetical protein
LAQIFPEWTNRIFLIAAILALLLIAAVIGFFWYYGSPKFTDAGYRPVQPVAYSHKLHAGDLGLDCRYCHYNVEVSNKSNVPPTSVCMNCHKMIGVENQKLLPVRESWGTGIPIQWIRVHKLPDYAYFNHGAHVRAGVGCASCHGNVSQMEVVQQMQPLSMSWCLDCHRKPDMYLRPLDQITNMNWIPPNDQLAYAARVKTERKIVPPVDCSGCHR